MDLVQFIEFDPEIGIAHRAALFPPMTPLPFLDPYGDALADVLGVGSDVDLAGLLEGEQALDGRHQLHAIVGGAGVEAEEFFLRSRSAGCRPIRPDRDCRGRIRR